MNILFMSFLSSSTCGTLLIDNMLIESATTFSLSGWHYVWGTLAIYFGEDSTLSGITHSEGSYGQWKNLCEHQTNNVSKP